MRLSAVVKLLVILEVAKLNFCEEIMFGSPEETYWSSLDMYLWTFNVEPDQSIFDDNFEISGDKSESVKGLYFKPNNNIKFLPVKLNEKFPNLVVYAANNCSLSSLKYEHFTNLSKLQILSFGTNQISSIEQDAFKDLTYLKFLFLNHNEIANIDDHTFDTVTNLRLLTLYNNQLSALSENIFINLSQLRNISISDNNIQSMNDNHFKNNRKLEWIWMHNNEFSILSSTMFDKMKNLKFVDLKENLCINDYYFAARFLEMKEKIKSSC
ncbi:unnamed protein product [Chironomus riparius]|uniref:Uncharacterized protein n=1 Tax=Chironomus riparius TaxID=315576 RepID=A0A9N9S6B7_9DIPT|nr:unnamed protein product [Chironomus riparius]